MQSLIKGVYLMTGLYNRTISGPAQTAEGGMFEILCMTTEERLRFCFLSSVGQSNALIMRRPLVQIE